VRVPDVNRQRRSAKDVIIQYTNELLLRPLDNDTKAKLLAIETIANRMSWMDLYNRLRFRKDQVVVQEAQEKPEQWWQK